MRWLQNDQPVVGVAGTVLVEYYVLDGLRDSISVPVVTDSAGTVAASFDTGRAVNGDRINIRVSFGPPEQAIIEGTTIVVGGA